jgi:predicted cupin superfamily sugar epimerase
VTASASDLVTSLELAPHPEGGWYREVHRSAVTVQGSQGPRSALTAIHYLLESQQRSRWHVVEADEVWQHQAGAPLTLLAYNPASRTLRQHVLGALEHGRTSFAVIPAGVWQAASSSGDYTLVSCTVGPGFEFEDFRFVSALPDHLDHFHGALSAFAAWL